MIELQDYCCLLIIIDNWLILRLLSLLFHGLPSLLERTTKIKLAIQTWVIGRHVLENETVTSRKSDSICASDKI
jgi:hypothetical protein